jgi:hypothetical protein
MIGRNAGDRIEGDRIYVEARKVGSWELFQMSGSHKGSRTVVKKNAKAEILTPYTNVARPIPKSD